MTGTLALYMRLSSEDANAGESYSIGNQRDLLHGYLKSQREFDGCTVLEFCDDGYSGTNFNRPDVQRMLSMAGNPIQCIIVKDFSRFGRNLIDVGDYLDQIFPFLGVRFIAVNENYDSKRSLGSSVSLDVSLKAMIYEMYSRDISEKIRCVQQAKMRKGEYLCAIGFYGYKRSQTEKNKLEIDEPAAAVVRRVFQMAATGMKPIEIARVLNTEQIPSPLEYRRQNHTDGMRGWKVAGDTAYWTRENVRRILSDERYTGCLISRKRTKVDVSTKRTEPVPKEDWIVAKDALEPIISRETFEAAYPVLKRYAKKRPSAKPKQLFRGLVKCAACGRTLTRNICKETYFFCPTGKAVAESPCREIHLTEQALTETLLAAIHARIRLLDDADHISDKGSQKSELTGKIQSCQEAIDRCKASVNTMFEDYADGRISREEYLSRKKEASERQKEAEQTFAALNEQLAQMRQSDSDCPLVNDLGKYSFAGHLTRELLEALVKEIRVSGTDTMEVIFNFKE